MTAHFVKTLASGLSFWILGQRPYASWMRLCARSLNNFCVDMTMASTFFMCLLLVIPLRGPRVDDSEKVDLFVVALSHSETYLGVLLPQLGVTFATSP